MTGVMFMAAAVIATTAVIVAAFTIIADGIMMTGTHVYGNATTTSRMAMVDISFVAGAIMAAKNRSVGRQSREHKLDEMIKYIIYHSSHSSSFFGIPL